MKITIDSINENYSKVLDDELTDFCKFASNVKDDLARTNMWDTNWESVPDTLPFLLKKTTRFNPPNGDFHILKIDNKIVAVAGVYISNFDENLAIGGVRSWVHPDHRGNFLIGKHILPIQLKWAREKKLKAFALSFNEYNKRLINIVKRSGFGRVKNKTPDMLFYSEVKEVPFPVNIQYTKQWVLYDSIIDDYSPNWDKIRYDAQ
jgi:N-acetylglutamate synthase-like GNAT family acetyltransferase